MWEEVPMDAKEPKQEGVLRIEFKNGTHEEFSLGFKMIELDIPRKSIGISEGLKGNLTLSISGAFLKGRRIKEIKISKR